MRTHQPPARDPVAGPGWTVLEAELERCAELGRPARLWLRDDDAVAASPPLERLIELTGENYVAVVLAVIPARADAGLAASLDGLAHVRVAVHGYAHLNHAPPGEKRQELGPHRPPAIIYDELRTGLEELRKMLPRQLMPMLVPPWNRIAEGLLPGLPDIGFRYLSGFGPEPSRQPARGLYQVNCRLDLIDWRGTRASFPQDVLAGWLARLIEGARFGGGGPVGILSHHLVHDERAWEFLAALFRLTIGHAGAAWVWPDEASEGAAATVLKPAVSQER